MREFYKPRTIAAAEAGRVLGVSRNVAYRLIREGTIPALRLGKKLRVPVVALEEMLKNPKLLNQQERGQRRRRRRAVVEALGAKRQRAEGDGGAR